MRIIIIILVTLMTMTTCSALDIKDVTFDYYEPGSLKIKYAGIRRTIIDEVRDFLEGEWQSTARLHYDSDRISFSQYNSSIRYLDEIRDSYDLRGQWWQRRWFKSFPPSKGGAEPPKTYTVGRVGDVIDLGVAKINQDFKFRFKEYQKKINKSWSFKFTPNVIGSTTDIISEASAFFTFTLSEKTKSILRVIFEVGYKKTIDEFIEIRIEILKL